MSEATRITPELASAARALLGWSRSDLAQHVYVSERIIGKYENGLSVSHLNLGSLRSTFESAGVEFIAENGGGLGVSLRKAATCANGAPWVDLTSALDGAELARARTRGRYRYQLI
jgi:hypothetical protein